MLNVRDPLDYPEKLKFVLEQITINEVPKVVGSTAYLQHKYPSDVDVFEDVTVSKSRDAAAVFYANAIKNIIEKIQINNKLFFSDIKIGEDPRYIFDKEIENTTVNERKEIMNLLYNKNLIDRSTYSILASLIEDKYEFNMAIRKYRVLRWTPEEVINGKKVLRNDKFILLEDAVTQDALIKLDVISWITSRYLSIEVFFNLKYIENGQTISFHPLDSYKESLLKAVEFYSMPTHYNPLKVAKRLWSLSRLIDCGNLLEAINPLLGSDPAALNQVVADIETIEIMLKTDENEQQKKYNIYTDQDYDRIYLQVLGFQKRIYNHSSLMFEDLFRQVYDTWAIYKNHKNHKNHINRYNNTILLKILGTMDKILNKEIFEQSKLYIDELDRQNIVCPV